jgi:carbon storage regulator
MLILSRKTGDAIVIDGGIRIVVVQCDRGGVRLGIEAPEHVTILRSELVDQVAAANSRAAAHTSDAQSLVAIGSVLAPKRRAAPANPPASLAT